MAKDVLSALDPSLAWREGRKLRPMRPVDRLHALDNLRACMMWLGIVLHVCAQHLVGASPLPWRDPARSPWADLLVALIHSFRMPVFFILAGFFAALLLQRRGPRGLLAHRFRRLALPFLLFWPPIAIGMLLLVMVYLNRVVHGSFGIDMALKPPPNGQPLVNTLHLWFLYLLWWFAVATAGGGWLLQRLPRAVPRALTAVLHRLGGAWWGVVLLALPLTVVGAGYPNGIVMPLGSLLPPLAEWVHNGLFFVFGLALWSGREALLPLYSRRCWVYLAAGLPFFLAAGALVALPQKGVALPMQAAWVALTYNAATWLWCFGLIGLFCRHIGSRRPWLAYLADSAYWVYLVHMLGTIGFGAVIVTWPLGATPKMLVNITLTSAAALVSYQLLVRNTAIGRLLNGPGGRATGAVAAAAVAAKGQPG